MKKTFTIDLTKLSEFYLKFKKTSPITLTILLVVTGLNLIDPSLYTVLISKCLGLSAPQSFLQGITLICIGLVFYLVYLKIDNSHKSSPDSGAADSDCIQIDDPSDPIQPLIQQTFVSKNTGATYNFIFTAEVDWEKLKDIMGPKDYFLFLLYLVWYSNEFHRKNELNFSKPANNAGFFLCFNLLKQSLFRKEIVPSLLI